MAEVETFIYFSIAFAATLFLFLSMFLAHATKANIVSVFSFGSGLGYFFGLEAEAFARLFWICMFLDCATMGACVYLKMPEMHAEVCPEALGIRAG